MDSDFNKYKIYGAYHWKWYKSKPNYTDYIDYVMKWIKEKNVLDIGAGDGLLVYLLKIKGIDNEPEAIRVGKKRGAEVVLGDAYNLPFKDEEFDSVFMGNTLEHFTSPQKVIKEARRVLKKYLYIVVPIRRRKEPLHQKVWKQEKLKEMVENEGFILKEKMKIRQKQLYAKFKKYEQYNK